MSLTPSPSLMSTPRPAMLVAIVTAPGWPGALDDVGLALVVLGVQHLVGDALAPEQLAQVLRHLDRDGADQHRLADLVAVVDVVDHGGELLLLGLEDQVVLVVAGDGHVGRDRHDLEAVDLVELGGLGAAVPVMPASFSYIRK